jgi:hypothetical protein
LEKGFVKKFSKKGSSSKTSEWGNPAQVRVYEKEKFLGRKLLEESGDKNIFENLW